jgi:hypothetical protein
MHMLRAFGFVSIRWVELLLASSLRMAGSEPMLDRNTKSSGKVWRSSTLGVIPVNTNKKALFRKNGFPRLAAVQSISYVCMCEHYFRPDPTPS